MPEKIVGLTLILDFFDRGHSLTSLHPPPVALGSLPLRGFGLSNTGTLPPRELVYLSFRGKMWHCRKLLGALPLLL